jgi:hypothetical protein
MADRKTPEKGAKPAPTRDDRLKAALKANLARRKAQAKARAGDTTGKPGSEKGS